MAKVNFKQALSAIEAMKKTDPWGLRLIGRQTGLPTWRELIADAKKPQVKEILMKAYAVELKIITACRNKDQESWDTLNAEMKQLTEQVKEAAE